MYIIIALLLILFIAGMISTLNCAVKYQEEPC